MLAATALTAALSLTVVDAAKADIAGLTPCSESKAFQKRQKNEVKNLQKRLKQVSSLGLEFTLACFPPCSLACRHIQSISES